MADPIDLGTWELFIAAMETGSILQAARAAGVDPSTVSRRLRKLEEALHAQLFYRDNTGAFPTVAGRSVLSQVKPVIREIEALKTELSHQSGKFEGRYIVGVAHELNVRLVLQIFAFIESRYPGLRFDFLVGDAPDAASIEPDLVLRSGRGLLSGYEAVGTLPLWCLASPDYLETKGTPQTPEELLDHRVIVWGSRGSVTRLVFSKAGTRLSVPCCAASTPRTAGSALMEAIADGGAAVSIPWITGLPYVRDRSLYRILPGWEMPQTTVIARAQGKLKGTYFASFLSEQLRNGFTKIAGMYAAEVKKLDDREV